jgi:hypothetical protein
MLSAGRFMEIGAQRVSFMPYAEYGGQGKMLENFRHLS